MSKKARIPPSGIAPVATGWSDVAYFCRKCTRKLEGGFGPDGGSTLRQAVRAELRKQGRIGTVGLVEVKCLGVCPKAAVTMGLGSKPDLLFVVAVGTPAAAVLDHAARAPVNDGGGLAI